MSKHVQRSKIINYAEKSNISWKFISVNFWEEQKRKKKWEKESGDKRRMDRNENKKHRFRKQRIKRKEKIEKKSAHHELKNMF